MVSGLVVSRLMEKKLVGWKSLVCGSILIWLVGWWSVVDGLVEYLSVDRWLVVGGRRTVGDRWFCNTPTLKSIKNIMNSKS